MKENEMQTLDSNDNDSRRYAERYIRWQSIRIEQFGFVNNLLIALSSGALFWQGQFLLENFVNVLNHWLFVLSGVFFFASVILGCVVAWSRLADFSLTAQIPFSLMEFPPSQATQETKDFRKELRKETALFDQKTRNCLLWQMITLWLGLLFVALIAVFQLFK